MGISDRLLDKKNVNGKPHIDAVHPSAALPGGEVRIVGSGLRPLDLRRPRVRFGEVDGAVVISSDDFLVARVPPGASSGPVVVSTNGHASNPHQMNVAVAIAENLHPVTNPALDAEGNIYATFSGSRGQKVPVAIFKIDTNYNVKPFLSDMMNPTAIAFDRAGQMYVSSRFDGTVYRAAPNGTMSSYAEGMGIATGIAFDREENLYVGDRSGTVFKIARDRQIFVFATLEPSVSAYHLAFGPRGDLFVTGPTTSSFDCVYKIDPHGTVSTFYRGLGRPQGLAFDVTGNLYVAASLSGKRGIVKITPEGQASLEVAGPSLVGLAFAPGRSAVLATTTGVYHLSWDIQGLSLLAE
ncbi:MAG TPA: IPT/TIG domain-containing protein [Terriglobales bacterium]|jgi:sugar lactone lactonase YvrE|nr:IPT/TIG domain-containing protein [Terriglobales bacterium]